MTMTDKDLAERLREWWEYDHARLIERSRDLIEQLVNEKVLIKAAYEGVSSLLLSTQKDSIANHRRAEIAEAKLEKAVWALQAFKDFDDVPLESKRPDVFEIKVRKPILATLAKLKGEKDE
jgi:hypothetical protein